MLMFRGSMVFVLLAATCATVTLAQSRSAPYTPASSIAIPDGRWDLLSYKAEGQTVFLARGDAVTVVDLKSGSAHNVGTIAGGHAALAIPGTNMVAVTSGQDNTLRLIDDQTGKQAASITVGKKPDAAIWDPAIRRILVMNADSGTVSAVDPVAMKVTQSIAVKPALELPALVGGSLLAINNEDASELDFVDLTKGTALAPLPLTGCEHPTGLAYDPADHVTLSACANGVAAIVDVPHRKIVKLLPIGAGPDGALFDTKRHRFIVPCGRSGTMSVFNSAAGGNVTAVGTVTTEVGARTAALDEASGRVFLPSATFMPTQAGRFPQAVPGSAHLLVFAPN